MHLTALADVGIYEGPGLPFLIALNSTAVMRKGATLIGDAVLVGQCYNGDVRWFHRVDGVGFVPWAIVRQNRICTGGSTHSLEHTRKPRHKRRVRSLPDPPLAQPGE